MVRAFIQAAIWGVYVSFVRALKKKVDEGQGEDDSDLRTRKAAIAQTFFPYFLSSWTYTFSELVRRVPPTEEPEPEVQPSTCLPSFGPPPMCHEAPYNITYPPLGPTPEPTDYCSGPSVFLRECLGE